VGSAFDAPKFRQELLRRTLSSSIVCEMELLVRTLDRAMEFLTRRAAVGNYLTLFYLLNFKLMRWQLSGDLY
jgi:hypothetical protein